MHVVVWIVVLLATHGAAALLGMVFKSRAVMALKKENDKLRASAESAFKKL